MNKTIAALATPPGIGGISVIRISGDNAILIADKIFYGNMPLNDCKSHTIHYGKIKENNNIIDTVTASIFLEPNSYTGENTIEISCHGGMLISNIILDLLFNYGATPAEPGEFTKRAFLNGKIDLTQVEAVADIIHSATIPGATIAARQLTGSFTLKLKELRTKLLDISGLLELELDFAEEDLEFADRSAIINRINATISYCQKLIDSYKSSEILRSGFFVAIAGYPNSGKSSLFNALLGRHRAIVSEIPGTTRDYLEDSIMINDIKITISDTAGLRENSTDRIEIEGIKMVESVLQEANMIIILNDITLGLNHSDALFNELKSKYPDKIIELFQNKTDLTRFNDTTFLSAKFGTGIESLKENIYNIAKLSTERVQDVLINSRHSALLQAANSALKNAIELISSNEDNTVISIEIRKATKILGELTGESWNEEVLAHIFSRFCIGK